MNRLSRWFNIRQAIAVSIIIIVVGVAATHNLAPLTTEPAKRAGWRLFREPRRHWTVEFPATWHAQRIAETKHMSVYSPSQDGILISNIKRRFRKEKQPSNSWSPWFDTSGAPPSLVFLQIMWSYSGGFSVNFCEDQNTPLPLSLATMRREGPYGRHDRNQTGLAIPRLIVRGSEYYSVSAVLGPSVNASDRATLDRIVRSISFEAAEPDFPPPTNCTEIGS